jgi:hypothetical protein
MHLVQILLPLRDNCGRALPRARFEAVERELSAKFKGLTAYTRSPAYGLWEKGGRTKKDEVILYEVITPRLNRSWWNAYRQTLEARFHQESVLIRAQQVTQL